MGGKPNKEPLLGTDPRVRPEQAQELDWNKVNRYWKRVTEQDLASTYVLCLLDTMLGYVLQFQDSRQRPESDRGWTGFREKSEKCRETQVNGDEQGQNKIIKLSCIEEDTRFIYRSFG